MSAHQKVVHHSNAPGDPGSVADAEGVPVTSPQADVVQEPCVDVPRPGRRFSDEELGARLGVPPRGSIRVSRENKCIVIVDSAGGRGNTVRYVGQDNRGDGKADQVMDGNNLDLALSKAMGFTVLHFTREGDKLVFDKTVECDSIFFERADNRNVIVFTMRPVGGEDGAYERLNPEIESALRDIESGTFGGEEYTPDEYIEYVKKVMG